MVKYADGPTADVQVDISATPEKVWAYVVDINTPAAFSDEFQRAEWVDEGPSLGARFRGYNRREGFGEWDVPCTVTAYEPERTFEWTIGNLDDKVAKWRFDVDAGGDGTVLRFHAEMGPGRSGLTPMIEANPEAEEDFVAARLGMWTENMQRTVDGIKALVEGGS